MTNNNELTREDPLVAENASQAELDRRDEARGEYEGMGGQAAASVVSVSAGMATAGENSPDLHRSHSRMSPERVVAPLAQPDDTDLERRVLAHERILQALIAHMSETEPKFLDRLTEVFCVPMQMVRREHDHIDADSYAEVFVQTLIRLGNAPAKQPESTAEDIPAGERSPAIRAADRPPLPPQSHYAIKDSSGVSRVTKDGLFFGDYVKEEQAREAVDVARHMPYRSL